MKHMEATLAAGVFLGGLLAALTSPAALESQQGFSFDARGGIALPAGGIGDLTDPGPSFGLRVGHSLGERFDVGVRGEVDLLPGADLSTGTAAPDMTIWRYGLGLESVLLSSPESRWSLFSELGLGATTFDTDAFMLSDGEEPSEGEFSETYLTPSLGLRIGFEVSPRVSLHLGATGHWMNIDAEDTEILQRLDPTVLSTFSSAWSVPVTFGVKVRTRGRRSVEPAPPPPPARPAPEPTPPPPAQEDDSEREAALETLRQRVHFDFDMSEIRSEAAALLDRKVDVMRGYQEVRLLIEGHADERGSSEYNLALGQRRSFAVRDYMVERGIAASRLETTSFGEERPLVSGSNESAWGQNRRAEFVVRNPEALSN